MAEGYFVCRTAAADAGIPVAEAVVAVAQGRKLLAVRMTDSSGRTTPVTIPTPEESESLSPGGRIPYALIDVTVDHPDYLRILARNIQIFPGQLTEQNFQMIPHSLLPEQWDETEQFDTPPQDL